MIDSNIIPKLLNLMNSNNENIQLQAVTALSIFYVENDVRQIMLSDGLEILIEQLNSNSKEIRKYASHILINLCRENSFVWEQFISIGGFKSLVALGNSPQLDAKRKGIHEIATLSAEQKVEIFFF